MGGGVAVRPWAPDHTRALCRRAQMIARVPRSPMIGRRVLAAGVADGSRGENKRSNFALKPPGRLLLRAFPLPQRTAGHDHCSSLDRPIKWVMGTLLQLIFLSAQASSASTTRTGVAQGPCGGWRAAMDCACNGCFFRTSSHCLRGASRVRRGCGCPKGAFWVGHVDPIEGSYVLVARLVTLIVNKAIHNCKKIRWVFINTTNPVLLVWWTNLTVPTLLVVSHSHFTYGRGSCWLVR